MTKLASLASISRALGHTFTYPSLKFEQKGREASGKKKSQIIINKKGESPKSQVREKMFCSLRA